MAAGAAVVAADRILCVDSPHYISRFGLNCEMHAKLRCDRFSHIGFSLLEVAELYAKCPIACQLAECSEEFQAMYNMDGMTRQQCEDDPTYKSRFGLMCTDHAALDCEELVALGMQPNELQQLLGACPLSCDVTVCPPEEKEEVVDNKVAVSEIDESGACFEGWDESCQDNLAYVSPLGVGCEEHGRIGCLKVSIFACQKDEII